MLRAVLSLVALGCAAASARPPDSAGAFYDRFNDLLDTRSIGASALRSKHPEWDGRGVVVAVLDTGVDMGVAGLQRTSDGKPKVIAVRDFSGQGVLGLSNAEEVTEGGETVYRTDEVVVRGLGTLPPPTAGWSIAVLREASLKNSDISDLNGNQRDDDSFAIAVGEHDGKLSAWVDTDGNLDFRDSLRVEDYDVAQQSFTLRLADPRDSAPITLALHLEEDATAVQVHFDDGGHGTHVAGIATGHGLMGRAGFDGIAPGAQVLSLKIGDNTLAGGATTSDSMRKALEFAGEWSKAHDVPVLANISYGIGSEIEGSSDMDTAVNEIMARFPLLVVSSSAGNSGPGLSTVGLPASATLCTAVAAMLPEASAETLFASRVDGDVIFYFSSRGGEAAKPDLVAPGLASASTPPWDDGDVKAGTSMAAPQVTGAYALVASAAVATHTRVSSASLKRALLASARPLEGYGLTDQGAGVPNVGRAVELVRKLAEHDEPFLVAGYRVTTSVATSASGEAEAAYFRAGTWLPDPNDGQTFTIQPLFYEGKAKEGAAYLGIVDLRAESSWLELAQRRLRFKGAASQPLVVRYSVDERTPGVRSGRVLGTPDEGGGVPAFSLWTTIVTPYRFSSEDGYALRDERKLAPAALHRYPLLVPAGATSLSVEVTPGDFCNASLSLYDPAGRSVDVDASYISSQSSASGRITLGEPTLTPGIWEVVVFASHRGPRASEYSLDAVFRGLAWEPVRKLSQPVGAPPGGVVEVTNRYDTRFSGSVSGSLRGFRRERDIKVQGDAWTYGFQVDAETRGVEFELRLEPKVYNQFTDVALTVFDGAGSVVSKDGFNGGVAHVAVPTDGEGSYRLELRAALADSDRAPSTWPLHVTEDHLRKRPIVITGPPVTLYPSVPVRVEFDLAATPPRVPDGFVTLGDVVLTDESSGDVWAEIPIITR